MPLTKGSQPMNSTSGSRARRRDQMLAAAKADLEAPFAGGQAQAAARGRATDAARARRSASPDAFAAPCLSSGRRDGRERRVAERSRS